VSHSDLLHTNPAAVSEFLQAVNEGIEYFNVHYDEAVEYISTQLDYSAEDARAWLGTVEFADDVRVVEQKIVEKTVDILTKAGVVKGSVRPAEMVVRV
jgi:ABC-type nitrate/sulfonate/bicarbonate transport system substrate-binding protein